MIKNVKPAGFGYSLQQMIIVDFVPPNKVISSQDADLLLSGAGADLTQHFLNVDTAH